MTITDKNAIKALKALDTVAKEYAQEGREYLRNIRWIPSRNSLIATDGKRILEYFTTQDMTNELVTSFGSDREVSLYFNDNELNISDNQKYIADPWRVFPSTDSLSTFQHFNLATDNNVKQCLSSTRTGKRYINNVCSYLIANTGIYFDINLAYGIASYRVNDIWVKPDTPYAPIVAQVDRIHFALMPKYKNWC